MLLEYNHDRLHLDLFIFPLHQVYLMVHIQGEGVFWIIIHFYYQKFMENEKPALLKTVSKTRIQLDAWGVRLVSILIGVMGAINIISVFLPTFMRRLVLLAGATPTGVQLVSSLTIVLGGFALFLLANSLWRRKQAGWILTLLLLLITTMAQLLNGPGIITGLVVGLIILLLLLRRSFDAYSDAPSVRQGVLVLASALLLALASGVTGFTLEGIYSHQPVNFLGAFSHMLTSLASFYDPNMKQVSGFSQYYSSSIFVIGFAALGFSLLMILRPVVIHVPATAEERRRVAEIVTKYGRSVVAPLAVFNDKHYFFSPGGTVIAYAVRGRGAMALGDPIGPSEDAAATISAFKAFCAQNDWQPFFLGVLPDRLQDYRSNGLTPLHAFFEAVVPLDSFSLEGHQNSGFRKPYNKLANLGYQVKLHVPPLEDKFLHELRMVNNDWLSTRVGGEKYFCVGWFNDDYIRNCPVLAVHTPNGKVTAFTNLLVIKPKIEITSDLVRYNQKLENGTMEFLIVSMLLWARSQGYETFSLTGSTYSGKKKKQKISLEVKTLDVLSALINPFVNLKGLFAFYDKFHPRWDPLYVAFPGITSLPLFLLTLIRVYSGKDPV